VCACVRESVCACVCVCVGMYMYVCKRMSVYNPPKIDWAQVYSVCMCERKIVCVRVFVRESARVCVRETETDRKRERERASVCVDIHMYVCMCK